MNEIREDSLELLHHCLRHSQTNFLQKGKTVILFPYHFLCSNFHITIRSNISDIITMNSWKFLQLSMFHRGTNHSLREESSCNWVWISRMACLYHGLTDMGDLPSLGKASGTKTQLQFGTEVCFIGFFEPLLLTKLNTSYHVNRLLWIKYTQKYILQV